MKIKWKILMITCIVCLLPMLFGVALWNQLPEEIAIHFDMNNRPDNFASKGFAVFGLPLFMVLLQVICCVTNDVNAAKFGERKKFSLITKWLVPIMTVILQGITFGYALHLSIDIRRWAMGIVALVLIAIGNYMPKFDYIKNKQNVEKEKARKINRTLGFATVAVGFLALVTLFLPPVASVVWLFLLIPYAIFSVVYTAVKIRS